MRKLLLTLVLATPFWSFAATLTGTVVGVSDGDTITVLDATKVQHKIRLSGIDAPEKRQAFGNVSKESLSGMVFQRLVQVDYQKTDRYGRLVGKVLVNGADANLEQVKAGLAWHYKAYQKEQSPEDRLVYSRAEEGASGAQKGLWSGGQPVSPWEWRRGNKSEAAN